MLRKRYELTGLFLVAFILFQSSFLAYAGWMDSWLTQKTQSSPGYFKGTNRGYVTGGSFNARWYQSSDRPITIETPKVSFGCGGINAYAGGVSFLNDPAYLQKKMEGILSSAAAVAFTMALQTISPQAESAITKLESIGNNINNLMIDDCTAGKELVAFFKETPDQSKSHSTVELAKRMAGIDSNTDESKEAVKANNDNPTIDDDQKVSTCPADFVSVYATEGSALEHLATLKSYDSTHIDLIRGFIGDVWISKPSAITYVATPIPACEENKEDGEGFISNNVYSREAGYNADGSLKACVKVTDSNADLVKYTSDILDTIITKMNNRQQVTATEMGFMEAIPFPIIPTLRMAVHTGQEATIKNDIGLLVARAYAYGMMADLMDRASNALSQERAIKTAGLNLTSPDCALASTESTSYEVKNLLLKAQAVMRSASNSYYQEAQRTQNIMGMSAEYIRLENKSKSELSKLARD